MKLTDAKVRGLKATEEIQRKFDGGGFFLEVSTKGAKTWSTCTPSVENLVLKLL